MIDTIQISVHSEALIIPPLEGISIVTSEWGTNRRGNFRNLLVNEGIKRTKISGSMQKFNRSELEPFSFEESRKAIFTLCDFFSIEPHEAKVGRVDFAKTLDVDFQPTHYFPFLGDHKNYFRSLFKNSLNYSNSNRALCFYDKGKEQHIPGNYFRYEKRVMRPDLLFKRDLFLNDLLTEEIYNYLLLSWKDDFRKIEKVKTLIPMEIFNTPTEFRNYLLAMAISGLGKDLVYSQIKLAQKSRNLSKQNALRIRKSIKEVLDLDFYQSNELIEELEKKILEQTI